MVFAAFGYRRAIRLVTSFSVLALFNLAFAGQGQLLAETAIAEESTPITDPLENGASLGPVLHLPPNSVAQFKQQQPGANLPTAQVSQDDVSPTEPVELPSPESTASPPKDPNARLRIPPNFGEGFPIERVFIYVRNPSNDPKQEEESRRQLANSFGIRAGGNFSPLLADQGLNQVQRLPFVESAEYRLYQSNLPGVVIVALLVNLKPQEVSQVPGPKPPRGMVISGKLRDFPTLYESDRSLVKLILNGGVGVFSDTNPWFGNPENFAPSSYQPKGTITWGEFYLEPGLAGITGLGNSPVYIYGGASYTVSGTVQPDIFRTDSRFYGNIERLYGGFLVAKTGNPLVFNLSAGRQIFQLNQGFLFSQFSGSANALDRAASYSNPRTAYEMTVLSDLRWGYFRLQGFFLEPDELSVADSNTQYLGISAQYNNNQGVEAVLTYVGVPQSSRTYLLPDGERLTRQGLQVINPRLQLSPLFGVPGLWFQGEYAYQFNDRYSMSAQGGYLWLGYSVQNVRWQPSFSYRFAGFSGDNPKTATYERFDPLQASGLTDWLQGISLGKVYNNSNSFSHRVNFTVMPTSNFELSLDYYYRFADTLNNLGGNPALQTLKSYDLGHELLLIGRYYLSQNFLLQGVGSVAFPGTAIRLAADNNTSPWVTLQVSLFMFF
ncbi:MAG: alginate export family protein [Microcystis aeruginosa PMC 728.11]|nr:alginate export family protein [Microcystis aeruginosa PMC 728.11]